MVNQGPDVSSLAEVLDRILDKGIVVDIWARISIVGIEILTIEARVVVASVDTYLHYAEEITKIEQAAIAAPIKA
ncbi:MAG: gas vesicle protein GvpJ [Nanoarchaeota archaeon]|nr:gas vesicle protein GvpJ [Nanoarchaeota archaeon]